jgi:hypothetical protein
MERGRQIAGRAKRSDDLDRYVAGGKVVRQFARHYHHRPCVVNFEVAGVCVADGVDTTADDYPSEYLMATLALAIGATVGFDGIPGGPDSGIEPAERMRRDEYNMRLRAWKQTYEEDCK